jgi:hypothetical protein
LTRKGGTWRISRKNVFPIDATGIQAALARIDPISPLGQRKKVIDLVANFEPLVDGFGLLSGGNEFVLVV